MKTSLPFRPLPSRAAAFLAASTLTTATACAHPQTPVPALSSTHRINAAQPRYGARVALTFASKAGSRDPQTSPEASFDGNTHSRCVLRGSPPYTFTITLPSPVPVDAIAFADSDYASERAPKNIEITLDDGTPIPASLDLKRPERRKAVWQEVTAGGRMAKTIRITVLSNHEPSSGVNWGGIGDIAVLTTADLDTRFAVPGGTENNAPAFVHAPDLPSGITEPHVTLPAVVPPGEHPRLLLSRAELPALKASLASTERGKAALKTLINVANGALAAPLDFPDPKGPPGQLKDRGDDVAKRHDKLSLTAGTLGIAWTLTGDRRYADRAAEILRGYAARYADYPDHKGANKNDSGKVMGQRLSEAMWLIPLIESYDYIYDSGALTPDDHKAIETNLIRSAIAFIRRAEPAAEAAERTRSNPDWRTAPPPPGGAANWLLFYNAATMMAGSTLGDTDMKDLAAADFRRLLSNGIGEDGMWEEGAIGYQFFAISAAVGGIETAARQGIDLWSYDHSRFKRLFDSPLRYAYPDGSAPGINDSGRAQLGSWATMSYDYAYLRYGKDPAYAGMIDQSPRQLQFSEAIYFPTRVYETLPATQSAAFPSTVFGNLGYSILRDPQTYALIDYGPHGGVHGHFDKLNLILYASPGKGAKGDEMGGEPQFHRYEDALHDEWTKTSLAHNTMTVDETDQLESTGKLTVFEDAPPFRVMRAEARSTVPGAVLDRTVVVLPDAVLDLYHGISAFPRTWDRTLRFQGDLTGDSAAATTATPLGERDGYQHLQVVSTLAAGPDAPWRGIWQTSLGKWDVMAAGESGQQALIAHGPDKDNLALLRQKGEHADFTMAYGLEAWPGSPKSVRSLATGSPDLAAAELTQRDGSVTTVLVSYGSGPWQALGWKSDARVLCLRRAAGEKSPSKMLVAGGTFAEGPEGNLHRPAPGNYSATIQSGKLQLTSDWQAPAPEAAAPKNAKTVRRASGR